MNNIKNNFFLILWIEKEFTNYSFSYYFIFKLLLIKYKTYYSSNYSIIFVYSYAIDKYSISFWFFLKINEYLW